MRPYFKKLGGSLRGIKQSLFIAAFLSIGVGVAAEEPQFLVTRPKVIDSVLNNPGMGFMTFQRFEGDKLDVLKNPSEGYPINYKAIQSKFPPKNFPKTKMAYFRLYWRFVEPKDGQFEWQQIDDALKMAHERHQSLMLRLMPYGPDPKSDVPAWYRDVSNEHDYKKKLVDPQWRVDPENPTYVKYLGRVIRKFGERYNGNPNIEAVDVAIIGSWGEGEGTDLVKPDTRNALLDAYFESFPSTPLLMQITEKGSFERAAEKNINVGWRFDCLGDVGAFSKTWSHMYDLYPQQIIHLGLQEQWRTQPVSMEVCGTLTYWKTHHWNIDYIIEQSLKWHMSSFNAKSSEVPKEWKLKVDRWLKKMGYRFALRKFVLPAKIAPGETFEYGSWWENLGVAPSYRNYPVALRFQNPAGKSTLLVTDSDIRKWLPGDNLLEGKLTLPSEISEGKYKVSLGIIDPESKTPKITLASEGRDTEGWYTLGAIEVRSKK